MCRSSDSFGEREFSRPPPIQDPDVYEAERVLDRRIVKKGKHHHFEYLVQWKGYSLYDATWEPVSHFIGSDVQKFRAEFDKLAEQRVRS